MGFVVYHEDVLHAHQVGHHPLEHLPLCLLGLQLLAAALQKPARACRDFQSLPQHERVVVRDDDLRPLHVFEHVAGNEFTRAVVVVRVIRQEHPEPVANRQARGDEQESAGEVLAARAANSIHRLPSDQHGHHGRLACACGQLQGQPQETGVRILVGSGKVFEYPLAVGCVRGNLGQPNRGLHGLDLAEERSHPGKLV